MGDLPMSEVLADLETPSPAAPVAAPKAPAEKVENETADVILDAGDDVETVQNEDESEDDAGDDAGETNEGESAEAKAKRKTGSQKWRERARKAEAERDELRRSRSERVAGDAQQRLGDVADPKVVAASVEKLIGPPPKLEQYADYLEFDRAASAYETDRRLTTRDVLNKAQAAQQAEIAERENLRATAKAAFEGREERVQKLIPDYDKVIKESAQLFKDGVPLNVMVESTKGPELVYYYAKRPDALRELYKMSAVDAIKEIGRIEARISIAKPKTETKAPPPVKTPTGGTTPSDGSTLDADSSWQKFAKKHGIDAD